MTVTVRSLTFVLCIGMLAAAASGATYGYFVDSEEASGSFQAANSFGGSGSSGSGGSCGGPSTTGGSDAPSVDTLTTSTTGNNNRYITIDAAVSDPDSDLATVDIRVNQTTSPDPAYENNNIDVRGGSDSVSDESDKLKNKQTYCVRVTVFDDAGNSDSTVTRQATD